MRRTAGEARIAQLLLDSVRYGFAPTKIAWAEKTNSNHIVNFDPRRVFPDPRVQWGVWDRLQFCIFSDWLSYDSLLASGQYPKLKTYPGIRYTHPNKHGWEGHTYHREQGRGHSINQSTAHQRELGIHHYFTLGDARVVDECWLRLTGEEINAPGIEHIYLVVTVLDEEVVIGLRLNPNGQQFPAIFGGLYQDAHKTYAQGLYDLLLPMHDIATWLLRSRIDNVQAALNNLIFAEPSMVSIPDLIDRNPWGIVRTLPGTKPGDGVFIAEVPDVTRGHWNDITAMHDLKQRVSAASDAQQGMPTPDVRTATEIQRLTQLGSQRLGIIARTLSATTIRPMVRMMVSNIQDAIQYEGSLRVQRDDVPELLTNLHQEGYIDFSVGDLQGDVQYLVIDGTLPLEPTRNAETWLQILQVMGQTGLQMEYRMDRIAEEAIRSMGITDLEQFRVNPQQQAEQGLSPSQQMAVMEKMRGASVQPNEQLQSEVDKGNLIPMREAANG